MGGVEHQLDARAEFLHSYGATVQFVGTVASLPVKPAGPSPLGSVRSQLRHLAKLRNWEQTRALLSNRFSAAGSVVGSLISNFGVQVYSGYNSAQQNGFTSILPSWQSFWTFGCGCVPVVQSTLLPY